MPLFNANKPFIGAGHAYLLCMVIASKNRKHTDSELLNTSGEEQCEESELGQADWTLLLCCQIKTPFSASKIPAAAAMSPQIKMPLTLPLCLHSPIIITNIYIRSLTAWERFVFLWQRCGGVVVSVQLLNILKEFVAHLNDSHCWDLLLLFILFHNNLVWE